MHNLADAQHRLDALIAAFAAAHYLVYTDKTPVRLHLGRPTQALDRLLDGRQWALITAHNPDGRQQSSARNRVAHARLGQSLDRIGPAVRVPTCNRDPDGQWPDEPGWLFTPDSMACADRLARRFGQRAIVTGGSGKASQLRVYGAGGGWLPEFVRVVDS